MGKKRIKVITEKETTKSTKGRIKSGKAEEARLADMGQKALEDFERIQAKASPRLAGLGPEKELEKELTEGAKETGKKAVKKPLRVRSKRYQNIKKNIEPGKSYSLDAAIDLVLKNASSGFDESVDVHLNLLDKVSGNVTLPHKSGKQQKVAIADDKLIEQVGKGKIDFDILVATPEMMPKLGRLAKVLGPKGLMPNPKTGTISAKPEEVKKKLAAGLIHFKSEPKAPLLHFTIGKASFGREKLAENLNAFIKAVKPKNIHKVTLASSMGPGVKLELDSLR